MIGKCVAREQVEGASAKAWRQNQAVCGYNVAHLYTP